MSTHASRPLDVVGPACGPTNNFPNNPAEDADAGAYRLLLVGGDRALLSRLSTFIEELGYEVDQAIDGPMALCAASARRHDFVIVEESLAAAGKGELLHTLEAASAGPLYALWLGEIRNSRAVAAALVAGFDDFLSKPVSHGELLSRLRAGARRLEFEQRWRRQAARDGSAKLPTKLVLAGRIAREMERPKASRSPTACVLIEIDYFDRLSAEYGERAARELFAGFAGQLPSLAPAPVDWFRVDDAFAAVLWDHSQGEAVSWAERFAKAVAAHEFPVGEATSPSRETVRLTVSQGVAELGDADRDGADLLRHAAAALRHARRLGRGVVARYDASLARQSSSPSDSAVAAGQRFVQAPARDFMTPCTVTLRKTDAASLAARLLMQGGHEVLPVVDGRGKLIGVVSADRPWPTGDASDPAGENLAEMEVADLMLDKPVHRDEQTTFPELLDFFTQSTDAWLVITRAGRPTGLIGRDMLASLTAPLCREDFRSERPVSLCGEYLFAT